MYLLVSPVVPVIIDLRAVAVTSPFIPLACYGKRVGPACSRNTKSIEPIVQGFDEEVYQRKGGRPGVLMASRGIQSVTALVQRSSRNRITCPPHLIFQNLVHATASLIFEYRRNSELRVPALA
ncbi:hypothetical protein Q1695_009228 [Nippostrongylus brasiliensis]|nr:hypothetical protein Q1695_009228 [Nippostrongylus brasiliensis]